jgi:hypothetical protein
LSKVVRSSGDLAIWWLGDLLAAMNPILRDMLGHQFWADAELWKAIDANHTARDDKASLQRRT